MIKSTQKRTLVTFIIATIITAMGLTLNTVAIAADDARQRLDTFFTSVSSIKGSFNQKVFSKKGKIIQNSSGRIYMLRPGKFRWIYETPDPQTIVSNGNNIWIYDEDLEQVTIKPMSQALSSAPIALLTRKQKPDAQFKVEPTLGLDQSVDLDWFKLTPHKESRDFKFFEVGLDKSGLRQMIMHDQLGQRTVLQLNVEVNVPISDNMFYFKIPEGVDVIGKAT